MSYTNLLDAYIQNPTNQSATLPRQTTIDKSSGLIQIDDLRHTSDSFKSLGRNQRQNDLPRTISPNSRPSNFRTQGTVNQTTSNILQRTHIIDEPQADEMEDIRESERMMQKRNEQMNQMIDQLLSGRKLEDIDSRPTRQRDLGQSIRSGVQENLRTSVSNMYLPAYGNQYLIEEEPERGTSSKHSDFFPTKKPVKNEYNIDQYLPKRVYLQGDHQLSDQVLGLTVTSPIGSQLVERINRRDNYGQTPYDLIPERLGSNKTDLLEGIGARRQLDFVEKGQQDKKGELQAVFEKVLQQMNVVENPGEIAEMLAGTVSQAASVQNKGGLSSSQIEGLAYLRGNQEDFEGSRHVEKGTGKQKVSRGCQTWSTNLTIEKTETIQYIPERGTRVFGDSPVVDIARPGQALVQTEKSFERRYKGRTEESGRKNTSPNVSPFSGKKSYYVNQNYSREDPIRIYDGSSRSALKSLENRNKSMSGAKSFGLSYTASFDDRRTATRGTERQSLFDIRSPENNLLKDIENDFLDSLQSSHKRFTSRLDNKLRNSKVDSLRDSKKSSTRHTAARLGENRSPSHQFNWSMSRSPGKFPSISEKVVEEGREENSFEKGYGSKHERSNLKGSVVSPYKSPKRLEQSIGGGLNGKKWNNVKFFEDEDLELLMKSYI